MIRVSRNTLLQGSVGKLNHMNLLGIGLYTPAEAAHITGANARDITRWLFGYKDSHGGKHLPLWETQIPIDGKVVDEKVIGFRDLMELRIIKAFTRHGVSLRTIRLALQSASEIFGTPYPFTANRFLTDGKSIFAEAVENDSTLTDLVKKQVVFEEIIRPSLYEGIEFSANGTALRWFPMKKSKAVVIDPDLSFGKPTLVSSGISTEIINKAVLVEKNKKQVAHQFGISMADVNAAVKFENFLLAA